MGHDIDECLLYLKENTAELRKLGSEWGMTEEEITSCINQALSRCQYVHKLEKSPKPKAKNFARKIWSRIRFLIKLPLCLLLLAVSTILLVNVLMTFHEPSDRYVSAVLQPYGYDIFRYIRLATLPVHQFASISNLYEAECLLENPLFAEPDIDCSYCASFQSAKEVNASDFPADQLHVYVDVRKPILFKQSLTQTVEYKDMRAMYLENPEIYDANTYQFRSTLGPIHNVRDLFLHDKERMVNLESVIQIQWESRRVKNSLGLRSLFPRPLFLPDKAEISLEKHVLIGSPSTPAYELPNMAIPNQLFTLGSGRRRVLVRPRDSCINECPGILVNMKAGDTLLLSRDIWRVFLMTNGKDPSVGYLTSFTI